MKFWKLLGRGGRRCARVGVRLAVSCAASFAVLITAGGLISPPAAAQEAHGPVATIDGNPVSGEDYRAYLAAYLRSELYHGGSPERTRQLAEEALDNLIIDRLLTRAAEQRGITGDPQAVEARMQEIRQRFENTDDWAEIEPRLPKVEQEVLIDTKIKALNEQVTAVEPPSEAELAHFYESNPTLFTEPPSWDLDMIMIGVDPSATAADWLAAGARAEELLAEIRAGAPFETLAAQNSAHESAEQGGALGRVHDGQLAEAAEAVVESLAVGDVSEPVRLLEGYAIFRLNERNEARLLPLDAVTERAESLYDREQSRKQWQDFIERLRADADIETFDLGVQIEQVIEGNRRR